MRRFPSLFFPLSSLLVAACGGAAAHGVTEHHATARTDVALSWRRVAVGPQSLSIELPGEPHQEVTTDAVPGLPLALNVSAATDVDGLHFEAGAHDFVGHEVTNPNAIATALLQTAVTRFGATVRGVGSELVNGAPAADAVLDAAGGNVVRLRVVAGRTRVYHPIVLGPREAMERHAADVDRFFASIQLEADEVPWQAGDGQLSTDAHWTPLHPAIGSFTVEMPGLPSVAPALDMPWPNVDAFSFQVATTDLRRRFSVLVWHFQNGARPPRDAIATLRHEATDTDHATLRDEHAVIVQGTGGRAWTAENASDHTVAYVRIFVTNSTVYALRAVVPAESDTTLSFDTAHFLDSFRLND